MAIRNGLNVSYSLPKKQCFVMYMDFGRGTRGKKSLVAERTKRERKVEEQIIAVMPVVMYSHTIQNCKDVIIMLHLS